ncbi:hypothetical protein D3C80_1232910 [compost metagenome]
MCLGVVIDALAVVLDRAHLAVHHVRGPANLGTEGQADGLVTQAHTQQRQAPLKVLDHFDVAHIRRMPRPRAQHAEIR